MNELHLNITSGKKKQRLLQIILALSPVFCFSQVQVAKIFSDNMVLPRNKPLKFYGRANPGKLVTVLFANEKKVARSLNDSSWAVIFKEQKENPQPQTVEITCGDEKIEIKNILVGDVWLCIGQSNMEWPMVKEKHWKDEIKNSNQPNIRLLNPSPAGRNIFGVLYTDSLTSRLNSEKFYDWIGWQPCDSHTVQSMSAVAYYFARTINAAQAVPIGIINLSIGGAPLETFISTEALLHHSIFNKKVIGNWLTNDELPVWVRERGKQNVGNNNKVPADEWGPNHAYKPGFAYRAGIEHLFPLAIKGILCYQGESNAQETERVNEYAALSKLMIDDYRKNWKQPDLPFYYIQLSSIDTIKYKGQLWPQFRDEQRKMLQLIPNSGMAVCSDIGAKDDVHPTNKKEVGERLARWALNRTYGLSVIPSGPLPKTAEYENGKVIISFQNMAERLKTSDGRSLKGFSLDGKNEIDARFGDGGILIFTGAKPDYVYYGWKSYSDGNLVNAENLPASTFKMKVQ